MVIERASGNSSLIDVLDRVLDKGIVIDAWVRVSVVGIELVTVEARVVVASIATYFSHAEVLAELSTTSPARRALQPLHSAISRLPRRRPSSSSPTTTSTRARCTAST